MHMGTLEAVTECQVISVSPEGFLQLVSSHPILRPITWEYALRFHERLALSTRPAGCYPSDLAVPGAKGEDIISSMSGSVTPFMGAIACETLEKQIWFWGRQDLA